MSATTLASEIAVPYAQALMALAKDQSKTDQFGDDANALLDLIDASSELKDFLMNPLMSADAKKGVLQQACADSDPLFANFLKLVIDKGRVVFLIDILKQYRALLRSLKGVVLAEVTAAIELTDEQKSAICTRVQAMTGAQSVELSVALDPDLLGGVIIKVGSQIVDASLRGQLRRLSLQLGAM